MRALITPEEVGQLARPCYADDDILVAIIAEAEREDVKPRLDPSLYLDLKKPDSESDLSDAQRLILNGGEWTDASGRAQYLTGLKTALAYYVYSRVVRDGNIASTRYGAVTKNDDNSNAAQTDERQRQYRQAFASADALLSEVLSYLDANAGLYGIATAAPMKSNRTRFSVIGATGTNSGAMRSAQPTIIAGTPGESAYELALRYGYRGSEFEWLESLHGADGESVYDILVREGSFSGTYAEFEAEMERRYTESAEAAENAQKAAKSATDAASSAESAAEDARAATAEMETLEAEVESAEALRGVAEGDRVKSWASLEAQAKAVMGEMTEAAKKAEDAAANSVLKSDIVQSLGDAEDKVMSQKAITDCIDSAMSPINEALNEILG